MSDISVKRPIDPLTNRFNVVIWSFGGLIDTSDIGHGTPQHLTSDADRLFAADVRKIAAEENNGDPKRNRRAGNYPVLDGCRIFGSEIRDVIKDCRIDHGRS